MPSAPRPAGLNLDGGPHQYPLPGSAAASALREVCLGKFSPKRGQAVPLARSISKHQHWAPASVGGGGQPTQTRVFLFLHPNTACPQPPVPDLELESDLFYSGSASALEVGRRRVFVHRSLLAPLLPKALGPGSPCPPPPPPPPPPAGPRDLQEGAGVGKGKPA